jgi:hypothetical protein
MDLKVVVTRLEILNMRQPASYCVNFNAIRGKKYIQEPVEKNLIFGSIVIRQYFQKTKNFHTSYLSGVVTFI